MENIFEKRYNYCSSSKFYIQAKCHLSRSSGKRNCKWFLLYLRKEKDKISTYFFIDRDGRIKNGIRLRNLGPNLILASYVTGINVRCKPIQKVKELMKGRPLKLYIEKLVLSNTSRSNLGADKIALHHWWHGIL